MTLEEYYGTSLPYLVQGEEYIRKLIANYPGYKTTDGIQPVLYIKTRIKTPESMIDKLKRKGVSTDSATALAQTHDAIGVRIICSFVEDVYNISKWLQKRQDIEVIEEKDYIAYPKPNGYRSLHLIFKFTKNQLKGMTVEIQIRTIAIDFWAALEHQIKYKKNVSHETTIKRELKRCADEIASVDLSMQTIRDILQSDIWD
ncbi:MAG: RelA/SpoT domain protein [Blautia sp.]|nr:RelA/SpoT domain protein [Blautia sp.]